MMNFFSKYRDNKRETWILAGLGNYGRQYENTRHNVGFITLDRIAQHNSIRLNKVKHYSLAGSMDIGGKRLIMIKPQTYMNNSGRAVADCASFYKVPPEHIIVVSDDVNLDVGVLRIRKNGSAGGHNGLKSIIECLGSEEFIRMRIGVGRKPSEDTDLADWVLGSFTQSDLERINDAADRVEKALLPTIMGNISQAMSNYNG